MQFNMAVQNSCRAQAAAHLFPSHSLQRGMASEFEAAKHCKGRPPRLHGLQECLKQPDTNASARNFAPPWPILA